MHEDFSGTSPLPSPKHNSNTPMSLSSYVTHPTGAGPRGPPAHMDGPLDCHCLRVAKTFFYGATCHSYYSINKAWLLQLFYYHFLHY